MARPQTENGHCRLANELLEAIIRTPPPSVAARQVWDWVWRNSWGRRGAQRTPMASARTLAEEVGASKTKMAKAIALLVAANMVTRWEDGTFSIQKDYEKWELGTRQKNKLPPKKQLELGVDNPVETVDNCPDIRDTTVPIFGTDVSPYSGQKCPENRDETVPNIGTGYKEKERKKGKERGAGAPPPVLPNGKNDTPRNRADLGHPDLPPEDLTAFQRFDFTIQKELTNIWSESKARAAKKLVCFKQCGRPKATETWPYCKPCTVCSVCSTPAGGDRKFLTRGRRIVCAPCDAGV